jgi:hypothetical protein
MLPCTDYRKGVSACNGRDTQLLLLNTPRDRSDLSTVPHGSSTVRYPAHSLSALRTVVADYGLTMAAGTFGTIVSDEASLV